MQAMRNGQNKRMRGRNRKSHNPLTRVYESNGPDVKIRGTPSHIAEKYIQLARDAQSSGDPVAAENYFQHAEHYFRLIASAQDQFRQNGPFFRGDGGGDIRDDIGDEGEEDMGQQPGLAEQPSFGPRDPQPYLPRDAQFYSPREHQHQPREAQNSSREPPAANRDPQGFAREPHATNRESQGFNREPHATNRETQSFNREPQATNRESQGFNREPHSFNNREQAGFSGRHQHSTPQPQPPSPPSFRSEEDGNVERLPSFITGGAAPPAAGAPQAHGHGSPSYAANGFEGPQGDRFPLHRRRRRHRGVRGDNAPGGQAASEGEEAPLVGVQPANEARDT